MVVNAAPRAGAEPRAAHDVVTASHREDCRVRLVRKAVFPAAGLGTRMLPATKAQPKEMLNVVDQPLIQYGVEEAVASGIRQVILVTAAGKTAMEDHFDTPAALVQLLQKKGDAKTLAAMYRIDALAQVASVRQREARGLGHAVLMAKDLVGDEPFCVFLPDDIIHNPSDPCLAQLIRVYEQYGAAVIAVERVPHADTPKYGVLAVEQAGPRLYRVRDMVEKPRIEEAPSDLAIMGRYVLPPEIFGYLEQTEPGAVGEIQLTDAIRLMLRDRPVYAYEYEGRRYDCGSKIGYLTATIELALQRPDLAADARRAIELALAGAEARA